MFSSLASITLGILFMVCQDAGAVPTIDKFYITRLTAIETTEGLEKDFLFPETMSYQVNAGTLGRRFTLKLTKYTMAKPPPVIRYFDTVLFTSQHALDNRVYNLHQVAFYKGSDHQTFLAEKCDVATGTCLLAGSISYDDKIWTISPVDGNPSVYFATISEDDTLNIENIINDANGWKDGEGEQMPILQQEETHSMFKREIRHRRSVATSCNILEVAVIGDASIWQYFLARNSQNATAALADGRQHYDALFRENASTDWSTLTGTGNVNITAGFDTCAQSLYAGADTPLCFTRIPMQFQSLVEGIRAAATIGVICSNETIESGLFEDEHHGLARVIALILALQINNDTLICSNSAAFNNTFRVDDQFITNPSETADYPLTFTFSNCSVDFTSAAIEQLNNESNNCLLTGNLTDAEFLELANHRRLAGEIIDIDHQCQLAFGVESAMCDLYNFTTGMLIQNDAICGAGEFCTSNGTCGLNQTIVYSGTTCGTNQICFKGECINNFTCGAPPSAPNGFYTLNAQADTGFLAEAFLNCQTGFETSTNITIKCRRDGWSTPAENCSAPTTTTTVPTTSQGQIAIG